MIPDQNWKPQRTLAALLGLLAVVCVILVDLGTETRLSLTLQRCLGAGLIAAATGYGVGLLVKAIIREAPEPGARIEINVPEELEYLRREGTGDSGGKTRNDSTDASEGEANETQSEREDAMVSEVT